ncbi:capsule biosynthesis protein GfcC [Paraburkholderia sp. RAU2J]|nr:capsule biosynthesis protein GfcC [Paraburkholderia sp. RAU2J]
MASGIKDALERGRVYAFYCLLSCTSLPAFGEHVVTISTSVRLGDWLAERLALPRGRERDIYVTGIQWQSARERTLQQGARQTLLDQIDYLSGPHVPPQANRDGLAALVASRKATGRVVLKRADPRWLQANPSDDPILNAGDAVAIPERPSSVTVIRSDGSLCAVPHVVQAEALYYIRTCDPDAAPDWVWVVQPDGVVQKAAVALWNRAPQDPPTPGAWIWAPGRSSGWPESLSIRLATFFATQGPSGLDDAGHDVEADVAPQQPGPAQAVPQLAQFHARGLPVTASDWGTAGLLQTPTARMNEAGEASISVSSTSPYTRFNVMLQPLDWLEFGFRYTDISSQRYGSVALSGTQSYKDKSIDFKVRLLKETATTPALAFGMRDVGGTGLFSGEYFVASKRTGDFDWSLGIGWGYLGARGNIPNPLSVFSDRFRNRPTADVNVSNAGTFSRSYFRGPMSLFGGVQYQTPWDRLILKLEYDGNNYQNEPFHQRFPTRTSLNFGAVYRVNSNIDVTAALERGNRAMFGVTLHGNLSNIGTPKVSDPSPVPLAIPSAAVPTTSSAATSTASFAAPPVAPLANADAWSGTARELEQQTGFSVQSVYRDGAQLIVVFDQVDAFYLEDKVDQIAAVLNRNAPPEVSVFRIALRSRGLPVTGYAVVRDAWVTNHTRALPPIDRQQALYTSPPASVPADDSRRSDVYEGSPQRFYVSVGPAYQQTLGGPNGFVLYQISANAYAEARLRRDTWLAGDFNLGIVDNYDKFTYTAPSNLPRVRTHLREYLTTSRFTMPLLQLTHVGAIGRDQFYSVYGGYLESMFAGVGAEWLYRPWGSSLALGVDVNRVRQRDFRQDFSLRDYSVTTGNVTLYWDTGWNGVRVELSVGQYLAKDRGATLDISRVFRNGVTIGAYATKTNVSSKQFGEGSFDKGIYVTIPFDALFTRSTGGVAAIRWSPLTRDGGAKLARQFALYNITDKSNPRNLWFAPPSAAQTGSE